MKKLFKTFFPTFICIFYSEVLFCQTAQNPKLHTPAEIMKIMEDSKLVYEIKDEFDPKSIVDTPRVLSNQMYLKEDKDGYTLLSFTLSEQAQPVYNEAEEAFHKKDYANAIELYEKLIQVQPSYFHALTLIGDAYYCSEKYDSAIIFFKRSITNNFADYNAHWFLADTYNKCHLIDSALKEITIAHLLNVNHENLIKALRNYRDKSNRPWKEWNYIPQYTLSKDGNRVTINTTVNWFGYALVKAVWKYEPGYAESMIGKTNTKLVINWPEEKEAVIASLSDSLKSERITPIIESDYISEFIIYELAAKRAPSMMMLLPRDSFYRVAEYVDKYH
jgi:hypothetical protein